MTSSRATSYIDLQVKRYADGDVSTSKFPAHWGTLPADESLKRAWESAMATRTPASAELLAAYQSWYGSLLHATKFRPEISAAMGIKIVAQGLEQAVAGTSLLVQEPEDDLDELKEEMISNVAAAARLRA